MNPLACDEASDYGDCPPSKAAWRRANSIRLATQKCMNTRTRDKPKLTSSSARRRRNRVSHGSARAGSSPKSACPHGKAQRHVLLPEWYRCTLSEQLGPAFGHGDSEAEEVHEEGDMQLCTLDQKVERVCLGCSESAAEMEAVGSPPATPRSPPTAETAVQCFPEEMLEPMCRTALFQKQKLAQLHTAPLWDQFPYSVTVHFSLFDDARMAAERASSLSESELEALAERFLGNEVAGVAVEIKDRRPPRLVTERHVEEAAILAELSPAFRKGLLASARRLLLGCERQKAPLCGRSLLRLADESAEKWAKLAHTALHFASRLLGGALPRAFAAEIIAVLADLSPTGLLLGLSTVLPAARKGRCQMSRSASLSRSFSEPTPRLFRPERSRTQSFPAWPSKRSVGTSLRPQDYKTFELSPSQGCSILKVPVYPCCRVSFTATPAEEVPDIELSLLPDYWRFCAGGEHLPSELEDLAKHAEEATGKGTA